MKHHRFVLLAVLLMISATAEAGTVQGKFEFTASSNVKMFKFNGTSSISQSTFESANGQIKSVEIRIPVSSLTTGMELRDKHMKERIFTTADGKTPDVVFKGTDNKCTPATGAEQTCTMGGKLTMRGEERPFTLPYTLKNGKNVQGETTIDVLSFGVKPADLNWTSVKVNKDAKVTFEATLQ